MISRRWETVLDYYLKVTGIQTFNTPTADLVTKIPSTTSGQVIDTQCMCLTKEFMA